MGAYNSIMRDGVARQAGWRVALWLVSLLASLGVLMLVFGGGRDAGPAFAIMIGSALPGWVLFLPLVFAFPNGDGRRGWILLGSGAVIGPVTLCGWVLFLILHGAKGRAVWQGDPLAPNTVVLLVFAALVGGLTAGLYALGLKLIRRASAPAA
ncbi:MAG TPA: hypothetical protein VHU44_18990 [Acidobacteriaceae bacterium]|jgi:hypothetical protein|nr:hypothetical protein [Acidobacteriaceae bacterium]